MPITKPNAAPAGAPGLKKALAQAMNAIAAKDGARALRAARAAHELAPANAEANYVMGLACEGAGRLADAARFYRTCLAADADHAGALIHLGVIALNIGKGDDAVKLLERAAIQEPANVAVRHYLARALALDLRFEDAVEAFSVAHRQRPRDAEILSGLARATALAGRTAEALAFYQAADKLKPGDDAIQQGIGTALTRLGKSDGAEPYLRAAIRLKPDRATPYLQLAQMGRMSAEDKAAAQRMALAPATKPEPRSIFLLALGAQSEHDGDAIGAFDRVAEANAIRAAGRSYDRARWSERAEKVLADIASTDQVAEAGVQPLLIVGMPRSGTTLVEQLLSRHSRVVAGGERTAFFDMHAEPASLDDEAAARLRTRYLAGVPHDASTLRITDKLPDNVFSLPLARRLFPAARVIVCRRHPLDVAWSIFKQGFGPQVPYAADLGHIVHHMRLQYRILNRWLAADGSLSTEVLYEELVQGFPDEARRIVDFSGLAWEDACLRFEDGERTVLTASATQVRQAVYTTSAGRWRALAGRLEGIAAELTELIDAHERKLAARGIASMEPTT